MKTKIYTLSDPLTNEIRYVGKTYRDINIRYKEHISDANKSRKCKTHNSKWIKCLIKKETYPIIEELDVVDGNGVQSEIYWISQMRAWGFNLNNLTDGGDGLVGYKLTEEQIKVLSEVL
jgi:hypothetical protein